MIEAEQVPLLIGDIYDAALDAAMWPRALERIYRFVGGSGAGLHVRDCARRTGQVFYEVGIMANSTSRSTPNSIH
jgi:hypothetical protein